MTVPRLSGGFVMLIVCPLALELIAADPRSRILRSIVLVAATVGLVSGCWYVFAYAQANVSMAAAWFGDAVALALLFAALLLLASGRPSLIKWAHVLAMVVLAISTLLTIDYAYQSAGLQRLVHEGRVPWYGAIAFSLNALAIGIYRIDFGPARILVSTTLGGKIARKLLPAAVLIPPVVGWIRLQGERFGLYGMESGVSLMAMATMLMLIALIGRMAMEVDVSDTSRLVMEDEIKKLNDSLVVRSRLLEDANKELEAFSYSVSHDLRAPLRSLDGFSQALAEDYRDVLDEQGKNFVDRISANAQRMGRLIDDLLSLARVGRLSLRCVPVDLSGLALSVIAELRAAEPDRNVEIDVAPELRAAGDPALLRIVVHNLLANAWKFTGRNDHAEIMFAALESDGDRTFFIRDNGAGFDMAYADKLFAPFQRLHAMDEFSGTGVGLATVQRIVARHGGKVWAEAAINAGATFYFTIKDDHASDDPAS